MPDQPQRENQQGQSQNIAAYGTARAQEKETVSPAPQATNRDNDDESKLLPKAKVGRWGDIEFKDRLMILATIGILLIAGFTGWIFVRQANVMQGQLDEMKGTGEQTERLITLNIGQLQNAKNLTEQARRNADNTERSINASILASRNDQRAWVGMTRANKPENLAVDGKPKFTVTLTNTGKSPALHMVGLIQARSFKRGVKFKPIYEKLANPPSTSVMQPGMTVDFTTIEWPTAFKQVDIDVVKAGIYVIKVFGKIRYTDVFKRVHHATFCIEVARDLITTNACAAYNTTD